MEKASNKPATPDTVELDRRQDARLQVALMWHRLALLPFIILTELDTESEFSFAVPANKARDAFDHPYAYMPADGA